VAKYWLRADELWPVYTFTTEEPAYTTYYKEVELTEEQAEKYKQAVATIEEINGLIEDTR
jgi:hypothetical protein